MSLVLNGTTQYAYRNSPVIGYGVASSVVFPFTVTGLFKSTSATALQAIWGESKASDIDEFFRLSARGSATGDPVAAYGRSGVGIMNVETSTGYSVDTWHRATLVAAASNDYKVYIDGASVGTPVCNINPINMTKMAIGALPYDGSWANLFAGRLAEVVIWDVALSDDERASVIAGYPPMSVVSGHNHVLAYWPLREDALDASGNGHDLSLQGGPSFTSADHPFVYNKPLIGGLDVPVQLTDMPDNLEQFGCEELDGLVYVVGGINNDPSEGAQGTHQKTTYVYDPDLNTWDQLSDIPTALQSPCLRAVNGKLYCIGGYNSYLSAKYDTVFEYDPDADDWTAKTSMPREREDAASAVVGGKIYIFGGLIDPVHTLAAFIDIYDPVADTWATVSWASPRALGDYGVGWNGKVYLVSGTDDMGGYSADLRAVTTVDEYDPDTDTFTPKANCPIVACYKEVVGLEGALYTFGGVTDDLTDFLEKYQMYDVGTDKWLAFPDLSYGGGLGVGMAENGESVFFGGGNQGSGLTRVSDFYKMTPTSLSSTLVSGTLSTGGAPEIISQSTGGEKTLGSEVTLVVVATGNPTPTYQWYLDDSAIVGATDASYTFYVTVDQVYKCRVTNIMGHVDSDDIVITEVPNEYSSHLFEILSDLVREDG